VGFATEQTLQQTDVSEASVERHVLTTDAAIEPAMTTDTLEKLYVCPGEQHPISRSVHLSRLAAFYPGCRDCPFRSDTGQLPKQTVERLQSTERRVERKSLFTTEGVRGVYLNELTRKKVDAMAASLAGLLWEDAPLVGRLDGSKRRNRRTGPTVAVGHDERPSSPDIVTGVVAGLRRMGCQVIDISMTTKPCFSFTVDHVQAAAGIYVTGGGCEPSWTGLDFVGRDAMPFSRGTNLERLEDRLQHPLSRATRHAGQHRTFQAFIPYEAGLWKHFHALRPLKVAYACSTRLVRRTLQRIFEMLPCRLISSEIPNRGRNLLDPNDADVKRVAAAVIHQNADLGLLIDDDGGRCSFFDEQGTLVPSCRVSRLIAELVLADQPGGTVLVETPAVNKLRPAIEEAAGKCVDGGTTLAEMFQSMRRHQAVFGGGDSGRFWVHENIPSCDAVLTLSKVLKLLSRSDTPFSQVVKTAS